MGRNIYLGEHSCYAINEGVYVNGRGVNYDTALAIAYLILRDLKRGYTYNHSCRIIPMDMDLAVKRLNYLYPLALKHYGIYEAEKVKELLRDIYSYGMEIPPYLIDKALARIVGLVKTRMKGYVGLKAI